MLVVFFPQDKLSADWELCSFWAGEDAGYLLAAASVHPHHRAR